MIDRFRDCATSPRRVTSGIVKGLCVGVCAAVLGFSGAARADAAKAQPSEARSAARSALPEQLAKAARRWKVNPDDVVVALVKLDDTGLDAKGRLKKTPLAFAHNADRSVAPASTAKLVTTLAGFEVLGATYHWYTGFYTDARPDASGVLNGNLYVRGGGDPTLVIEDFMLQVDRLAQMGVKHFKGDIVVDRSYFNIPRLDPGAFDGRRSRPYNLPPDAALLNYRNLSLDLVPDREKGVARVVAVPPLAGVTIPSTVKLTSGACGDWKTKLGFRVRKNADGTKRVFLDGGLARSCGAKTFNVIAFESDEYFERVFRALWVKDGRTWTGHVKAGRIPEKADRSFVRMSPSLAEVAVLTNKWSNNVMARHIFLSLGEKRVKDEAAARDKKAAASGAKVEKPRFERGITYEDARGALADWLASRGIDPKTIHIDNGSGLSRETRVTGRAMAELLAVGWHGPYMPEYAASMPVTGKDGTMRKRNVAVAEGRIKTGFLADVRSIGGYIHAKDGTRYALYASVHGKANMPGGIAFLDNVIDWAYKRPGDAPEARSSAKSNGKAAAKP